MNKTIKYMLSACGEHLMFIIVSAIFISIIGSLLKNCVWIISVITGIIYLSSIYSAGWRNSGKDMRSAKARLSAGETQTLDYKRYNGFIYGILLLAISAVLCICHFAIDNAIAFSAYRIYNLAFVFLFDYIKVKYMFEIIVVFLPYLCYSLGYVAGKNRKTFVVDHIDKLIYKSKKK